VKAAAAAAAAALIHFRRGEPLAVKDGKQTGKQEAIN